VKSYDGFGILALASVCPILSTLIIGLVIRLDYFKKFISKPAVEPEEDRIRYSFDDSFSGEPGDATFREMNAGKDVELDDLQPEHKTKYPEISDAQSEALLGRVMKDHPNGERIELKSSTHSSYGTL